MSNKPGATPELFTGGELPDIGATLSETLNDVTENIGSYAMAGLGMMVVMIPYVLVMFFGIYMLLIAVFFGGAIGVTGLTAMLPSELAGIGGVVGILLTGGVSMVLFLAMLGVSSAIIAPINASLVRAIAAHQRGDRPLEFTAAFSAMGENVGAVILGTTLLTLLSIVLAMMCYLPALLPVIFLSFATPLIVLHSRGAMEGIRMALAHARSHLSWHLKYGVTHFLVLIVSSQIPVIGYMFAAAFHIRMYRKVFGDSQEPVLL